LAACALTACGGAGPYGFARTYEPVSAEEPYLEEATYVGYEELRRDPEDYRSTTVGWFGVVTDFEEVEGSDRTKVHMTFRTHQDRHLCSDEFDSSCRVTVSEHEGGPFTAIVSVRPEHRSGRQRLWQGSLLKVYGSPTGDFDDRGGPILEADWYRHWPRGKYVTTGARAVMRR
jgi:hypothetical protein